MSRTKKEAAEDLTLIIQYRKNGVTWRELANKINAQRDYDISYKNYYQQYMKEFPLSLDQKEIIKMRKEMINAINLEIDELLDSWEKSKEIRVKKQQRGIKTGQTDVAGNEIMSKQELTVQTEQGIGDVSFLVAITKKRERLAKLTGADVPERTFNTNVDLTDKDVIKELEKELRFERKGDS
jgi:hypothetical protein